MCFWLFVILMIIFSIQAMFFSSRETASEGYEQRMEERYKAAKIHNEEYDRRQRELAQQKTVRVKQYYRRKPKRK